MKLKDVQKGKGKEAVKKVYGDFVAARNHQNRRSYERAVEESDKAFLGEIFNTTQEADLKKDGIPVCKTNKGAINSIRYASILTASRPEITAIPIGGSDSGVATLTKRNYKKIWNANKGESVAFDTTLDSVKEGLGWAEVFPQRYNGIENRTVLERTPPSMVLIDPTTKNHDLSDRGFTIKWKKITKTEAKEVHKLKDNELYYVPQGDREDLDKPGEETTDLKEGGSYDDVDDNEGEGDENIEEWKRSIFHLAYYQTLRRSQQLYVGYDENQQLVSFEEKPAEGNFEEVDVIFEDLLYVLVVGTKMVKWTLNPIGKDHNGRPIQQLIPLVNIPVKKAYPRGNLFYAIPALQELSKRRGQSIAVVAATSGSPHWYKEGTLDKEKAEKALRKPKSLIGVDGSPEEWPKPAYQATPDISRIFELESRAEKDADNAWQLNPALKGEAETSKMSGKLQLLLKEAGLEGSSYFMVNLHGFFREIAVAITAIELRFQIPTHWDSLLEEEDYIKDDKGEPTEQVHPPILQALEKLKAGQISILKWDIQVQPGSSLPSARFARLEFFSELAKTPVHPDSPMDIEGMLEMIDYPGKQELLKRRSKLIQANQQLQQLQLVMKEMQDNINKINAQNDKLTKKITDMEYEQKVAIAAVKAEAEITSVAKVENIKSQVRTATG